MRIAFVTQWFPPEPGTIVAAAIADGLAERGHSVDVLTGFPNYPTGKLHDGYRLQRYRQDLRSARVAVHRAPLYPSHDSTAAKRMINYLSYAMAASWVGRTRLPRPDVWLVYSSPATSALPALTAPKRMRAPVYLMIQDLWPDSVTQSGLVTGRFGRNLDTALQGFCNWTYRRAKGIGVISPSMKRVLVERGVESGKIHLTPNWVEDGHLLPSLPSSPELRRRLSLPVDGRLFMYAGNMGELQGLEPLVLAFAQNPEARLALIGGGVARGQLEDLVKAKNISNVCFMESQPTESIGRYIAASDIQVVSLKDTPLLRATMPSKVQNAMAAGRPILAHAAGDVASLVTSSGAGMASKPGDIAATDATIKFMTELPRDALLAMGHRARARYTEDFSPAAGVDKLESLLTMHLATQGAS